MIYGYGLLQLLKPPPYLEYDDKALDPANPKPGPASNPPNGQGYAYSSFKSFSTSRYSFSFTSSSASSAKHQTPAPVEPTNISFQPYPPEISTESLNGFLSHMDKLAYMLAAGLALVWAFTAFGRGFFAFSFRTSLIGGVAFAAFSMVSITRRNMEKELERVRMDLHRTRGEKFSPPTPESVEWLNALLKTVWGLINPDMFISVADMVEDVMQASLPGFIVRSRPSHSAFPFLMNLYHYRTRSKFPTLGKARTLSGS